MIEGKKTSEFKAMVGGVGVAITCLAAVLPVILKSLPEDSPWAVVVAALLAVVTTVSSSKMIQTYIAGRSAIKVEEVASKAADPSPEKPSV